MLGTLEKLFCLSETFHNKMLEWGVGGEHSPRRNCYWISLRKCAFTFSWKLNSSLLPAHRIQTAVETHICFLDSSLTSRVSASREHTTLTSSPAWWLDTVDLRLKGTHSFTHSQRNQEKCSPLVKWYFKTQSPDTDSSKHLGHLALVCWRYWKFEISALLLLLLLSRFSHVRPCATP